MAYTSPFDDTPPPTPSPPLSVHLTPRLARTNSPVSFQDPWNRLGTNFANLSVHDEAFNPEMQSPNDMMVDTEEHIVEPTANGAENDNLTIINPDNLETEAEQLPDLTRADDCTFSHHYLKTTQEKEGET